MKWRSRASQRSNIRVINSADIFGVLDINFWNFQKIIALFMSDKYFSPLFQGLLVIELEHCLTFVYQFFTKSQKGLS
jgi:hypothetical protein